MSELKEQVKDAAIKAWGTGDTDDTLKSYTDMYEKGATQSPLLVKALELLESAASQLPDAQHLPGADVHLMITQGLKEIRECMEELK